MDEPEMDPELDKLINDLENVDLENKKFPVQPLKVEDQKAFPAQPPKAIEKSRVEPKVEKPKNPHNMDITKKKEITILSETDVKTVEEDDSLQIQQDIRNKVINFITNVLGTCDEDRKEVQNVINFLREKSEFDDGAKDAVIEQLVQSLKTKNEINDTAVRAIDSMIKLLGVEKKGSTTKNTNNFHMTPEQLKDLLDD